MTAVGTEIFTDEAWSVWEPLIEEVRPRGKTPPKELRRTIAADVATAVPDADVYAQRLHASTVLRAIREAGAP